MRGGLKHMQFTDAAPRHDNGVRVHHITCCAVCKCSLRGKYLTALTCSERCRKIKNRRDR